MSEQRDERIERTRITDAGESAGRGNGQGSILLEKVRERLGGAWISDAAEGHHRRKPGIVVTL